MKVYIFPKRHLCPKNNESHNLLRAQVLGCVVYIHILCIHCTGSQHGACSEGGLQNQTTGGPSPALLPTGCVISSKSLSALRLGLHLSNVDTNGSSIIWVIQVMT